MPRLFIVEQSALAEGGHYHAYTSTIASAAKKIGLDVVLLTNKRFVGAWAIEAATIIPAFQYTWGESEQLHIRKWEPGNIAYDFVHAVHSEPPRAGDHILFATLGYAEMTALLEYVVQLPITHELPVFHILLRYDFQFLRDNISIYRPMFDRIAASTQLRRSVLFHSDTHLLSVAFSELTGLTFSTLPIPFRQDYLVKALEKRSRSTEPLVVTYLGDARLEKNFAAIPAAIEELWSEYVSTRRVRFVLQSNFNVEGGEDGMLRAVQRLGQYLPETVELIHEPMDSESYSSVLAAADIVIIPYDAERYRARSSGILIEAMAAGKPVVTTSGTWMASQVSPKNAVVFDKPAEIGAALKKMIDGYVSYKTGADVIAPDILRWSSGENFLRTLLSSVVPRQRSVNVPRILVVANGDTLVQRNGAGFVSLSQLRYLRDADYNICAIFIMNKRNLGVEAVEAWTDRLRERVAEFDFEAAFLAGSGRLSFDVLRQREVRHSYEHSIAADLAEVNAFDVPLELVNYLHNNRPDAIVLNNVTNAPLIDLLGLADVPTLCETHDIQSFQKAIYGGRRIEEHELRQEINLLSRYDHLISISPAETDYLQRHLPKAKITTTGVFPAGSKPPVANLAGCTDFGEVVSSCLPELPAFDWDAARQTNEIAELLRLAAIESLDLIYVSSNHLANVSGLQWFLEQVYKPFLAPTGVSLVVAGSIREAAVWPVMNRLFFTGRLEYLAPIYSAGKIVILPVIEGAGVAVKAAEALSFGRPIVATPFALRGIEGEIGGVEVASTPVEFARAIRKLLASQSARADLAKAARKTALRMADPARYAELLNGVFVDILGVRAVPVQRDRALPDLSAYEVEWDTTLVAVNRLVRNWLENLPIDVVSLRRLAAHRTERVRAMLQVVLDELLVQRSAYLLSSSRTVRTRAFLLRPSDAARGVDLLSTAIALFRPADLVVAEHDRVDVIYEGGNPIDIFAFGEESIESALKPGFIFVDAEGSSVALKRAGLDTFIAHVPARRGEFKRLFAGSLQFPGTEIPSVLSQPVLLDESRSFDKGTMKSSDVHDGSERVLLIPATNQEFCLPHLLSPHAKARWLDLVLAGDGGHDVNLTVNGFSVATTSFLQNGFRIVRSELPQSVLQEDLSITVRVMTTSVVVLAGAITRLVFGAAADDALKQALALDLLRFSEAGPISYDSQEVQVNAERQAIQSFSVAYESGLPLRRSLLKFLQTLPLSNESWGTKLVAPDEGLQQNGRPTTHGLGHGPLLDPLKALTATEVQSRYGFVSSWVLPIQIEATFATREEATRTTCQIDGHQAGLVDDEGPVRRWHLPGRSTSLPGHWLHVVAFGGENGRTYVPTGVQLAYRLSVSDLPDLDRFIMLSNFYSNDGSPGGFQWMWSSDKYWSSVLFPIALSRPGKMRVLVSSLGENVAPDDIRIVLNGSLLEFDLIQTNLAYEVAAHFAADRLAATELAIGVRNRIHPDGDPRTLGIAISEFEFVMDL